MDYFLHNEIIVKVPDVIPNSFIVKSTNLPTLDGSHFSTKGCRIIGRRYGQIMLDFLNFKK